MRKIFGEDSFFNKEMAKFYKAQDEYVYNEMSMAIKTYMPTVVFDREKLERWVNLCLKLDNIDNSDLIDMATQKKFEELKYKLSLTEKALELACNDLYWICAFSGEFTEEDFISRKIEYYTKKAKEMMKNE